jgi:hypothetical protein
LCRCFLDLICEHDGIDDSIRELANALGFSNLEEVDEISINHGQCESGLVELDCFGEMSPLSCYEGNVESYSGDFPSHLMSDFSNSCSYEIHSWDMPDEHSFRRQACESSRSPLWIRSNNQKENFDVLVEQEDYQGAWFCLNSIGWKLADAKASIQQLASFVDDSQLATISEYWLNRDFSGNLNY